MRPASPSPTATPKSPTSGTGSPRTASRTRSSRTDAEETHDGGRQQRVNPGFTRGAPAGYKFIYGDKGIVTSLLEKVFPGMDPGWFSGLFAVLVVMTFATTTNHMLFVANALKGIDYQTVERRGTSALPP